MYTYIYIYIFFYLFIYLFIVKFVLLAAFIIFDCRDENIKVILYDLLALQRKI